MLAVKSIAAALVATAATLGAGVAHAGGQVSWSIGINAPIYAPVPVYVQPEPVYLPRPVYVVEPVPVYYPRQIGYYEPVPAYSYHYPRHERRWHHGHRHWEGRDGWRR